MSESADRGHVAHAAIKVHRHHGACPRRDRRLRASDIELEAIRLHIDEDRSRAGEQHRRRRGDKGGVGNENLITRSDLKRHQPKRQGQGAIRREHAVLRPHQRVQLGAECPPPPGPR